MVAAENLHDLTAECRIDWEVFVFESEMSKDSKGGDRNY